MKTITAGIDVGSSAIKVVLVESEAGSGRERGGARIIGSAVERIRKRDPLQVAGATYADVLKRAGLSAREVDYVATTGEGEGLEIRTGHFYGMTAHARGAIFLDPAARALIDAGALHARAITVDPRAKVLAHRMTSQCASGSGQFLENVSRYLGVSIEEVGALSLKADAPEKVSGICAVLAETDVINMVSRGITLPNILRGIHESMAARFVKLLRGLGAEGVTLVTGGLGADPGLLEAMRESAASLGMTNVVIRSHPEAVLAGALGAALWGAYRHERLAA